MAGYYLVPAVGKICDQIAEVKTAGGWVFSSLTTIFASLVLPELAKRLTGSREVTPAREIWFRIAFFGLIGSVTERFYYFMGLWMGTSTSWEVVLRKVLVDQFGYSPAVTIPYSVIAFLWCEEGFSAARTRQRIREGEFRRWYPKTLGICWGYWGPTLAAVYAMPPNLQFILFLFAQGAWSLLLVHISKGSEPTPAE